MKPTIPSPAKLRRLSKKSKNARLKRLFSVMKSMADNGENFIEISYLHQDTPFVIKQAKAAGYDVIDTERGNYIISWE